MFHLRKLIPFSNHQFTARCLSLHENYLKIESVKSALPLKFHYFWLRDHCRCSECYNHKTSQITSDLLRIPFDIKPTSCQETADKLEITWADGHKTEYSVPLLKQLMENRKKANNEVVYWDQQKLSSLTDIKVTCKEYFDSEDGQIRLYKSILKYGFGLVTGVEPTLEATEKVVRHSTRVSKTIFGEMWDLTNDMKHDDTAYSTIYLGAHTDNTYFSEATGVMVFHMLQREGTGGETLLVDGFNAINNLKNENPSAFDILTKQSLESEYRGDRVHYVMADPVIKLHPVTKEILQIRYNAYDRAYLNTLQFEDIIDFYKAYVALGKEIRKESNEWWLKLQPGDVIFINNWRLLHGRAEYTGRRTLGGCYITRSDWTSSAKRLGLPLY